MAEEKKIPINMSDDIAGGVYSNMAVISHSDNEFIMDFVFALPPKGKVNSRVIMSPLHAKRFLKVLEKNLQNFESKFGIIKDNPNPPPNMGIEFSKN